MKSNYEYDLISKIMKEIDTLFMPNHASKIKHFTKSDYQVLQAYYNFQADEEQFYLLCYICFQLKITLLFIVFFYKI